MVAYSVIITYPSVDIFMFSNSAFATHFRHEYTRAMASAAKVKVDNITILSITENGESLHAESELDTHDISARTHATAGFTVVSSVVRFPATDENNWLKAAAFANLLNTDPSSVFANKSIFGGDVSAKAAKTTDDEPLAAKTTSFSPSSLSAPPSPASAA
mmetsp:Transcript_41715/g.69676  ORF Transcript_41715/g.69676 Transcript_41715/m.69676 type:complete len:160 (+) Transcript_41715:539-1018(+)